MSAASFTHPQVIGIDGETRPWNEVFTARPTDCRGLSNLAGYVVRGTYSDSREHIDLAVFYDPAQYIDAALVARQVRNRTLHADKDFVWAVVDNVYSTPRGLVRSNG
jgi:hypothetical protein